MENTNERAIDVIRDANSTASNGTDSSSVSHEQLKEGASKAGYTWLASLLKTIGKIMNIGSQSGTFAHVVDKLRTVTKLQEQLLRVNVLDSTFRQQLIHFCHSAFTNLKVSEVVDFLKSWGILSDNIADRVAAMTSTMASRFKSKTLLILYDVECKKLSYALTYYYAGAVLCLGTHIWHLYDVWKEVRATDNLVKEGNSIKEIETRMEKFEGLCEKLREALEKTEVNEIGIYYDDISKNYEEALTQISELRMKIEDKIHHLNLRKKNTIDTTASAAVATILHTATFLATFNATSALPKIINGSLAIASLLVSVAGGATHYMTAERIEKLQESFQELEKYKSRFQELYQSIRREKIEYDRALRDKSQAVQDDNKALRDKLQAVQDDNKALRDKLQAVQDGNKALIDQIKELADQVKGLAEKQSAPDK